MLCRTYSPLPWYQSVELTRRRETKNGLKSNVVHIRHFKRRQKMICEISVLNFFLDVFKDISSYIYYSYQWLPTKNKLEYFVNRNFHWKSLYYYIITLLYSRKSPFRNLTNSLSQFHQHFLQAFFIWKRFLLPKRN